MLYTTAAAAKFTAAQAAQKISLQSVEQDAWFTAAQAAQKVCKGERQR